MELSCTVVDNGSRPEALRRLEEELSADVELLRLGHNAGFGPGANAGLEAWLEHRHSEWVLVAPHDAMPGPHAVERLLAAGREHPALGLASADVGDGLIPVVDPYFGSISRPARREAGLEPSDYPHGTLLLARRSCLVDIGLFDDRYFAYCEEADLGLRAKDAGWEVGIVRDAAVRNPSMGPGPGPAVVDYLMLRNTILLVREQSGRYHAFIRYLIGVMGLVGGVVRPTRRPELFSIRGRLLALVDVLRRRYGPPPEWLYPRGG